uniref:Mitogen-activated protein kinase kinase kinase n=1 Tax=Syphacia muris TaxID=451379 RepID=A0A0N5AA44_9BILA
MTTLASTEDSDGCLYCSITSVRYDGNEDDCILGKGAYGIVKRANLKSYHFALKIAKENHEKELRAEIETMKQLNHENIVALKYIISDEVGFLMELVEGGTLHDLIHDKNRPVFAIDYVIRWAHQIASAVAYMHQKGFIHCDLKPANFLLKPGYRIIKLADFGSTISVKCKKRKPIGTALYQAPEAVNCLLPDGRIDVYSFGISFWEAAEKKKPQISPDGPGPFILTANEPFIKLLKRLWTKAANGGSRNRAC